MPAVNNPQVEFPEGFDDFGWEAEAKGWLPGVRVRLVGHTYTLTFYDPVRLAQDLEEELRQRAMFAEKNLVVVNEVTRACVIAAVAELARTGSWDYFVPDIDETSTGEPG